MKWLTSSLFVAVGVLALGLNPAGAASPTDGLVPLPEPMPFPEVDCPDIILTGTLGSAPPAGRTGTQIGRLNRDGNASSCAVPKTCLIWDTNPGRNFDEWTVLNESGNTVCVTTGVAVDASCGTNSGLQANAYLGSYDETNICSATYLADPGLSSLPGGAAATMSFEVPPGAVIKMIVHEINPLEAFGCNYTLTISGELCAGTPTPTELSTWGSIKATYK